ncbi:hypothetical protein [Mycobacterium botniense]|uniref:Uncharacterized protein n=1 Tax=Mycobacterium botniense TaxID=84962 RepID=A0A7I9Y1J1_9MYCO|nr:hypothetical protein [Mycobacterium botniense]GFG75904.1 hypothetical protein MBOT_32690 [Mycobacterium botniense]
MMFVARGRLGPFGVDGEPITDTEGTVAVRTVLHDQRSDDHATTVGSYRFRPSR